jgi:predicted acyl esterase
MRRKILWTLILAGLGFVVAIQIVAGQGRGGANPELLARRHEVEKELQSIAIVERKLMIPMRDGKRMAADLYRPKDASKKYPTVFVRTRTTSISGTCAAVRRAI